MTRLTRSTSGTWMARKGIPADVRAEYRQLFGAGWEAKLNLPAALSPAEAKAQFSEWLADVESRVEGIRARRRGDGQGLTHREARALSGAWYRWFTGRHETAAAKHTPRSWQRALDAIADAAEEAAPELRERHLIDLHDWLRRADVREGVRPLISDRTETAQFLAAQGVALTPDAHALFLDFVAADYVSVLFLFQRRAQGDYSPDELPREFPSWTRAKETVRPWSLFDRWVAERQPAASTVRRWRTVLLALDAKFPDANAITEDQAREWIRVQVGIGRSAHTVRETWLSAASRIFRYGVEQKLVAANPFDAIKIEVPRQLKFREKAFTTEEAATILAAARASTGTTFAGSLRRWVPWLCAYSGARVGEICQLRGKDIRQVEGIWAMVITPEAGSVKTGEARTVPLHDDLIAQGFLAFVKTRGAAPLFYDPAAKKLRAKEDDALSPRATQPVQLRIEMAKWVRTVGVTDPNVSPNHSWRHTFKKIADKAGISERTSDAITGHAPTTAGRGYGRADVADMAAALKGFPCYR